MKFGSYLRNRRNFMKYGVASVGVPGAVGLLWMFGGNGGVGWWLFLVVLALAAGWMWAYLMWLVLGNDLQTSSSASPAQKVNGNSSE